MIINIPTTLSYYEIVIGSGIVYGAIASNLTTEQCISIAVAPDDIIQQHFARFDEKFFQYCDKELLKINTFFSGRYICSCFLVLILTLML